MIRVNDMPDLIEDFLFLIAHNQKLDKLSDVEMLGYQKLFLIEELISENLLWNTWTVKKPEKQKKKKQINENKY